MKYEGAIALVIVAGAIGLALVGKSAERQGYIEIRNDSKHTVYLTGDIREPGREWTTENVEILQPGQDFNAGALYEGALLAGNGTYLVNLYDRQLTSKGAHVLDRCSVSQEGLRNARGHEVRFRITPQFNVEQLP